MSEASVDRWGGREKLREMVSRPHVVEVLDVLTAGPLTIAQMQSALPGARRGLGRAVRDLLVSGLVVAAAPGSRDEWATADQRYRHTARGRAVVALLSRFSVWVSLYDD